MRDSASIHSLPPEILSMIFSMCLPEQPSFKKSSAPLSLTGVCSQWRSLALDTASLWAPIHLTRDNICCKGAVSLTDTWLERSQGRNIDVTLGDGRSSSTLRALDPQGPLMARIKPHCNRFMSLNAFCHKEALESLPLSEMTSLRELRLNRVEVYWPWSGVACVNLSEPLPHLHRLFLRDMCLIPGSLENQIQLTHLDLNNLTVQNACNLLATLPKIVSFEAWLVRGEVGTLAAHKKPTTLRKKLPDLRALRIHICHAEPGTIFDAFAAPNLEELSFELPQLGSNASSNATTASSDSWDAHRDFLFAGGTKSLLLKKLSIAILNGEASPHEVAPVDLHLLEIFRASPHLQDLSLHEICIKSSVWRELVLGEEGSVSPAGPLDEVVAATTQARDKRIIPQLVNISFDACSGFCDADIIPMLRSRKEVLKKVELSFCKGMRPTNRLDIEALGIPSMSLLYNEE